MFGLKAKDEDRVLDPNFEKTTTAAYPGFIPQRYIRPTQPGKPDQMGDPSQVPNNVDRGTESHGLYIDSDVHPQDDPYLDYEKDHDAKDEVLPEKDLDCPLPVRVVETPARRRRVTQMARYTVAAPTTTDRPYRLVGQDRDRIRVTIGIITSGTTNLTVPGLANSEETQFEHSFALTGFNLAPGLTFETTEELWIIPPTTPTAYTLSVLVERELPIDLPTHK